MGKGAIELPSNLNLPSTSISTTSTSLSQPQFSNSSTDIAILSEEEGRADSMVLFFKIKIIINK